MDGELFKKIINYYGESRIIGLGFDNSAGLTFREGEFTLATNYIDDLECIHVINFDNKGVPFHTIKPVDTVQAIYVADAGVNDINTYDRVSIRG